MALVPRVGCVLEASFLLFATFTLCTGTFQFAKASSPACPTPHPPAAMWPRPCCFCLLNLCGFLFACGIHFPSVRAPFPFISMAAQVTRGRSQSIPYHRICGFGSRRTTIAMGLQTYNREIAGFTPIASSALQPTRAGTYCLLPTTHYFPVIRAHPS